MASGETLVVFHPYHNEPPSTNYATFDTRNNHVLLAFDDTTNESAIFSSIVPQSYAATTGWTIRLYIAAASAITGDSDWDVEIERIEAGVTDVDSDSFATAVSLDNTTVPGTSGFLQVVSINLTDGAVMDSVQSGEPFRLRITRDAVSDTAVGDMQLFYVEIRET